jgi:hypothetical protein
MKAALRALAGRTRLLLLVAAAALAAGVAVALIGGGEGSSEKAAAGACPAGQRVIRADIDEVEGGVAGEKEREKGKDKDRGEAGDYESHFKGRCAPVSHPESNKDLTKFSEYASTRQGSDSPQAFAKAVAERQRMENSPVRVAGAGGTWSQYGHGPLIADDPTYPTTLGDGFGKIEGRINDLLYVPQNGNLYAAVAQGGLWESANGGANWKAIGDNLPIQSTGSVGYTPAGGGTLIVATGDMAFSNDYAGVGTYWSDNDGKTWHKSRGAPAGALSFRVATDPTNPNIVYTATGFGLYRSTDAGRSFTNVDLPTGACHGNSHLKNCFFANVVTDVAVQPTDKLGHKGGAVVAAVGWRDGARKNLAGAPEAPGNGLYRSDSGAAGSFSKVPDSSGFTAAEKVGRVALGTTTGDGQDSRYLYAVVQDAQLFAGSLGGEQDIPLVGTPSVLDGIYVSGDFGKTWKLMESRQEFFNPANGSALSQLTALGIAPGYQVTYNEFIKPDPTRQLGGVPTRVILGMEEVWQTTSTRTPQNGHSQFQAIGEYTANGGACLVVPEQCGTKQAIAGNTTTHPDQHAVNLVPDGKGGVTLFVGNDGGAYAQHVDGNGEFNNNGWGDGINKGFETLLPYGAAMAKDGTVYAGLQDNGQLKILPNGEQHTVYVGDGTNALVDPDHSDIAYDELPNAGVNVSTDGGKTWSSIDPSLKDPDFVAPLVMDPGDAKHIIAAGRDIAETTSGPDTTTCKPDPSDPTSCTPSDTDWKYVFDLGTHAHPTDKNAGADEDPNDPDAPNHASAAALNGDNAYVGFCGDCDPVKRHRAFNVGFATNVGGDKAPKRGTSNGWHIAAAKGLPNRIITDVTPDPKNPKTVYVTLGSSASRYFAPIGSEGESTASVGKGHVFKSTNAGATFKNVSGDLPDVQATAIKVRAGQLIVGTAIGVFVSSDTDGGKYGLLGRGMPAAAVYSMQFKPGDGNLLMASTYGRGIYTYRFTGNGKVATIPKKCRFSKPYARFTHKSVNAARRGRGARKLRLRGLAKVRLGCGHITKVQVSVARKAGKRKGKRVCRYLNAKGRFSKRVSCSKPRYIAAKGTKHWRFTSKRKIPRGTYTLRVRSIDSFKRRSPVQKRRHTIVQVRRR